MTPNMLAELAGKLEAYLVGKMPEVQNHAVKDFKWFHGGGGRHTFGFTLAGRQDGQPIAKPLILRRDPIAHVVPTPNNIEFNAYRTFYGSDVPVPKPYFLEENDGGPLERPFFIMERITQGTAPSGMGLAPYGDHHETVGQQFWDLGGKIAAKNYRNTPLALVVEEPPTAKRGLARLEMWLKEIRSGPLPRHPVVEAALRYLFNTPLPPLDRLSIVHGDFRSGNFIYNHEKDGDILAILDWEEAHLGDPLEDVAWAIDALWAHKNEHPGAMIPLKDALQIWEDASGMKINEDALYWWRVFSGVKGWAIWSSSARLAAEGQNQDPVLTFMEWQCPTETALNLLDVMGH